MNATLRRKPHGEAEALTPLNKGLCDYCNQKMPKGAQPTQRFCQKTCRSRWWSRARNRGAQVYRGLELWRKFRGAKGTPGEGQISKVAREIDAMLAQDRAEQKAISNG